jgi:hypothetical protein
VSRKKIVLSFFGRNPFSFPKCWRYCYENILDYREKHPQQQQQLQHHSQQHLQRQPLEVQPKQAVQKSMEKETRATRGWGDTRDPGWGVSVKVALHSLIGILSVSASVSLLYCLYRSALIANEHCSDKFVYCSP